MPIRLLLTALRSRHTSLALAVGLLGAVLLIAVSRGVIVHAPHYDELLHVLAAQQLLETGEPAIADGEYRRAELFTHTVAWSMRVSGSDELVAARMPSLLAAALLSFALGVWLALRGGLLTGAAAVMLMAAVPTTVAVAVFARFYTLHALFVTLMLIAMYEGSAPHRTRWQRAMALASLIALTPLAWHLQATTMIAVGVGVVAVAAVLLLDHRAAARAVAMRHPLLVAGGFVLLVAVAIGVILQLGFWDRLRTAPLWSEARAEVPHYFLIQLRSELPWLWPLFPLAAVLAMANRSLRRLAVFSVIIVGLALLLHSIAAQKAMRYISYVLPWLSVVWACALAGVLSFISGAQERRDFTSRGDLAAVTVLLTLAIGFVLSSEGTRMLNLLTGRLAAIDDLPYSAEPDWAPVAGTLTEQAAAADILVTSNSMKSIYYLGRYDYELNATIVPETDTRFDFGRDYRTGSQAIAEAESIGRVLDMPGAKLVVLEDDKIGRGSGVREDAFAVIESRCAELPLPADVGVRSWWCGGGLASP